MTVEAQQVPAQAESLAKSRDYCRDITRTQARNFYHGLKLLPEPKRSDMYALYAYMRLADDIADDDGQQRTLAQRQADLDRWEADTRQAIAQAHGGGGLPRAHQVWPAFVHMVRKYGVPEQVFIDMIAGQRQDLTPGAMATFADLHQYCYRVASVVGVASLYVFGFEGGEETIQFGVDRGIAFQLTNILRDLHEDATRGRCYIPQEDLARFGVTLEQLKTRDSGGGFTGLIRHEIARAQEYYERSKPLESRVAPDARPTLAAMTAIYHGILEKIADRPEAVLRGRVGLSGLAKLRIGWRAMRGGNF
jgi:phytoene synthase